MTLFLRVYKVIAGFWDKMRRKACWSRAMDNFLRQDTLHSPPRSINRYRGTVQWTPKTAGSGARGQSCDVLASLLGKMARFLFLFFFVFPCLRNFYLEWGTELVHVSFFLVFYFFFSLSLFTSSSLSFFAVPITQTSQMVFSRNIFPYEWLSNQ